MTIIRETERIEDETKTRHTHIQLQRWRNRER
jgi:hypothetical protein